jgi:hypothetical protein
MWYSLVMNDTILTQASTLPGMTPEKLKSFGDYLSAESRSETTREQRRAYREISVALENCPITRLAMRETRRILLKAYFEPSGNARLYGLPLRYRDGIDPSTYVPKDNPDDLRAIWEYEPEKPLSLKIDAGVGEITSGIGRFRLHGRFLNCDDPKKVGGYIRRGRGLPIERLAAPEAQKRVSLPANRSYIPAFLFVGNRLPELCDDGLVYVGQRYWDEPEDFGMLLRERTGFFALRHLRNDTNSSGMEQIKRLDREIARLRKAVAKGRGHT